LVERATLGGYSFWGVFDPSGGQPKERGVFFWGVGRSTGKAEASLKKPPPRRKKRKLKNSPEQDEAKGLRN